MKHAGNEKIYDLCKSGVKFGSFLSGYELIHHRVTQGITEFNQFEIKRIELRDTLCYSVVKTHIFSDLSEMIICLFEELTPLTPHFASLIRKVQYTKEQ